MKQYYASLNNTNLNNNETNYGVLQIGNESLNYHPNFYRNPISNTNNTSAHSNAHNSNSFNCLSSSYVPPNVRLPTVTQRRPATRPSNFRFSSSDSAFNEIHRSHDSDVHLEQMQRPRVDNNSVHVRGHPVPLNNMINSANQNINSNRPTNQPQTSTNLRAENFHFQPSNSHVSNTASSANEDTIRKFFLKFNFLLYYQFNHDFFT